MQEDQAGKADRKAGRQRAGKQVDRAGRTSMNIEQTKTVCFS